MKYSKQSIFITIVSVLLVLLFVGCSNLEDSVNVEDARVQFIDEEGVILATEYDLVSGAKIQTPMGSDQQEVTFSFEKASKLADTTDQNIGKEIRIYLDGEMIVSPRVMTKNTDGSVTITNISNELAIGIMEAINR